MSSKDKEKEAEPNWFIERILIAGPPLVVLTVISFIYGVFMVHNLIPQMEHAFQVGPPPDQNDPNNYVLSVGEIVGVTVAFHVLFFLMLLSFLRCYLTPAGHIPAEQNPVWKSGDFGIPRDKEAKLQEIIHNKKYTVELLEKERAFLKSLPVVERKDTKNGSECRRCGKCNLYKPDRAHHCRVCKECVLRMDHHCPWVANCIGFNNYKYFLLFLFYASACLIFFLGAMLRRLIRTFRPVVSWPTFMKYDLPVILAFLVALFLCIALVMFFFFHMSLVVNALTTIELREKRDSDTDEVRHRWAVAHMKYDQGSQYQNFLHVFGSPWMWLLPIQSNLTNTDGTYSETPKSEDVV